PCAASRVERNTAVPDVGQGVQAAVEPDASPAYHPAGPPSSAERTLDGHRRLDRDGGPLEDREELVGAGVDLAAPRTRYRRPEDAADVVQQVAVAVAQLIEEGGGGLDIRHQQGYEPGGEGRRIGGCRLDLTVSTLFFDGKAHGG